MRHYDIPIQDKIIETPILKCVVLRPSSIASAGVATFCQLVEAKGQVSVEHLPVWMLYEKILFPAKSRYFRPVRHGKKEDYWGSLHEVSVSRTDNLVRFSRTNVSRVMTAYKKLGKVSSAKQNSGRRSNLIYRHRHAKRHCEKTSTY